VPLELGGYDTYSGTSMAAPHVAGTVALLLGARPDLDPATVRDVLQNSAMPATWSGDLAAGVPDSAYRQGAGMVRIDRSILSRTIISPGKLSVGESAAGPFTATLSITNKSESESEVMYELTHVPGASTTAGNHWLPANAASGGATVDFGTPMVTLAPGEVTEVSVTITANPALADGSLFGGYIVFTPHGGAAAEALRVPYAGFKGDYQSVPILTPADQSYPWLGKRSGSTYTRQASGATYTLQAGDTPYIVAHLDHNAARVTMDITEATTGKPWGRAMDLSSVGQNTTATATEKYAWNGTAKLGKQTVLVPNGRYLVKLSVLKALGDAGNPAHWETWTSPPVTINHP
jgi:minor extracellular serine protease Vpr